MSFYHWIFLWLTSEEFQFQGFKRGRWGDMLMSSFRRPFNTGYFPCFLPFLGAFPPQHIIRTSQIHLFGKFCNLQGVIFGWTFAWKYSSLPPPPTKVRENFPLFLPNNIKYSDWLKIQNKKFFFTLVVANTHRGREGPAVGTSSQHFPKIQKGRLPWAAKQKPFSSARVKSIKFGASVLVIVKTTLGGVGQVETMIGLGPSGIICVGSL